jgi:hypothetical protein
MHDTNIQDAIFQRSTPSLTAPVTCNMAESDLRQRIQSKEDDGTTTVPTAPSSTSRPAPTATNRIGVVDVIRVLLGVALVSSVASYFVTGNSLVWNRRPQFTRLNRLVAIYVSLSCLPQNVGPSIYKTLTTCPLAWVQPCHDRGRAASVRR